MARFILVTNPTNNTRHLVNIDRIKEVSETSDKPGCYINFNTDAFLYVSESFDDVAKQIMEG